MTDTGHRLLLLAFALVAAAWGAAARPADLLQQGEYLARAGDCVACHSAPGGKPFAGGLKMAVPFVGVIYTTNITPDPKTGIGKYSFEDFVRAMRRGIARDGHRLYPAMPYPSYAKVADDDLRALYAFFMRAVPAVERANQAPEASFPLNMRWPLAIWDGLFVPAPGFERSQRGAAWNRGAYLVQGLGHCGSCHTPRGLLAQEKGLTESASTFLSGAELDQWSASNLRGDVLSGLGGWSEADLVAFLQTGHNSRSTAFGTMIEVINNSTQHLSAADLWAIARYLKSLAPADTTAQAPYIYEGNTAEMLRGRVPSARGAKIYLRQCVACHVVDGRGYAPYLPPLSGNPAVLDSSPASLINITLNGSARVVVNGLPDAYRMPQSRIFLSDQDVADVVTFIRTGWGNKAAAVTAHEVAKIRASTSPASDAVVILKMR
jgi:alcohol dehydrogenase (quinone), cytochrome c subunit